MFKQRTAGLFIVGLAVLTLLGLGFYGCEPNQETGPTPPQASIGVRPEQVISENHIVVSAVSINENGVLVARKDNNGQPDMTSTLFDPVQVQSGVTDSIIFTVDSNTDIADGDKIWFTLQSEASSDAVIMEDGAPVQEASTIIFPKITASDQTVGSNTVTVSSVTAGTDGWVAVHLDDGTGKPGKIMGYTSVSNGENSNVTVTLADTMVYPADTTLYPMLHIDASPEGEFNLPADKPEIAGPDANVVMTSLKVEPPAGLLSVQDQVISQNTVMVDSIEMSDQGWVVFHADNGSGMAPQVPGIISDTVQVPAGTSKDVGVGFNPDVSSPVDGQLVWVMLHTDNGTIGKYQFPSAKGFDAPIMGDQGPVMTKVQITAPKIAVSNQAVASDSTILVDQVTAADSVWLVLHMDNGGQPGDIIGWNRVAGDAQDVKVRISDVDPTTLAGKPIWVMMHIDAPPLNEFQFPGDDVPEVFGFDANNDPIIVMEQITLQ